METATYLLAKSLALFTNLNERGYLVEADHQIFNQLRQQLTSKLRDHMLSAVSLKNEKEIEKIA